MFWSSSVERTVDAAVAAARAGVPSVLDVQAAAGFGKSTLVRTTLARFDGAHVVRARAEQDHESAGQILHDWGVPVDGAAGSLASARALGELVDRLQLTGPVVLVIDDLQWADPESLNAVGVLLERSAGDRLLVIAAHRPTGPRHTLWLRRLDLLDSVHTLTLTGLELPEARQLVLSQHPRAADDLVEHLRRHTGGSPLLLRSLLREHPHDDLQVMAVQGRLPAPAALVASMHDRIATLGDDATDVLHAVAVLGDEWSDADLVDIVSQARDPAEGRALLQQEQLISVDHRSHRPRIRIFHGAVRAAVYGIIPADRRRQLHRAAAARAATARDRLRHRAAAVDGTDEGLAGDLDRFADTLHDDEHFREAARVRRLAATVSPTSPARRRRELHADYESVMARDLDDVHLDVDDPHDEPLATLVRGAELAVAKQSVRAAGLLLSLTDTDLAALDTLDRYRAHVLRAATVLSSGGDAGTALAELDSAEALHIGDTALTTNHVFARGQAEQRTAPAENWPTTAELLRPPRTEIITGPAGLEKLYWRGISLALAGLADDAIADLHLVVAKFAELDLVDTLPDALIGLSRFLTGRWRKASIALDIARADTLQSRHAISLAIAPLGAVIAGDVDRLEADMTEARTALTQAPLPVGVHTADIVDILALSYLGTDTQRSAWLPRRIDDLGDPAAQSHHQAPQLWFHAHALAARWAGGDPAPWLELLRTRDRLPWADPILDRWNDDSSGPVKIPATGLLPALDGGWLLARARQTRSPDDVARAEDHLRSVGGDALIPRLRPAETPTTTEHSVLATLSDRERDVTTLLLEGLSYAQISKELFITRSTVAFHLSRVYAKTGTTSRHELVQAVRAPV